MSRAHMDYFKLARISFRMLVGAWWRQPAIIRDQPGPARSSLGTRLARISLGSAQLGSFQPRVSRFDSADGTEMHDTQPHSHVAEFIVKSIVFEPWQNKKSGFKDLAVKNKPDLWAGLRQGAFPSDWQPSESAPCRGSPCPTQPRQTGLDFTTKLGHTTNATCPRSSRRCRVHTKTQKFLNQPGRPHIAYFFRHGREDRS